MRKGAQLFIAAAFAVTAAACGGNADGDRTAGTPGAAGTAGEGASVGMGERTFIEDQLKDGMREIQLGQLAQQRAASADVKQFASTMVEDHTRAGNELKQLAQQANVKLDNDAAEDNREASEKLSKLNGREFDREYIDMMVKDHQDAVDTVQDQAQNAEHPGVKQWAATTLPRLKHHLEMAQSLQNQLGNQGASRGNRQ